MALLKYGSPEFLTQIFQSCDKFSDIAALSLTNKHLNSIWTAEAGNIIWRVGNTTIPSFDLALITVRATGQRKGQLPPNINIPGLEGKSNKPDTTELRAVLDLAHFVSYIEFKFLMTEKISTSWVSNVDNFYAEEAEEDKDQQRQAQKTPLEQSPHLISVFQERFHRAVYHFFILGAILTRAFQEPIYARSDVQVPLENFLGMAVYALEQQVESSGDRIFELPVNQQEVKYLSEYFPAYDFVHGERWEECFGHVGEWLMSEIAESCRRRKGVEFDGDRNGVEGERLRQLLSILVILGQLRDMGNGIHDGDEPFWSTHYPVYGTAMCACMQQAGNSHNVDSDNEEDLLSDTDDDDEEEEEADRNDDEKYQSQDQSIRIFDPFLLQPGPTRTAQVIYLGDFEPSWITVSASPTNFSHPSSLIASRLETNIDAAPHLPKVHGMIPALCAMLWCQSGRPNTIIVNTDGGGDINSIAADTRGGYPTPHPPLHIFTYLLRKYFRYRFDDRAFEVRDSPGLGIYETFIRNGRIFLHGDDGDQVTGDKDGLLVSVTEGGGGQSLTYRKRGWSEDSHW